MKSGMKQKILKSPTLYTLLSICLLYTSDAADY